MQGGQNKQSLGYTIVEVLIVLAVSSFMFVIAANFINGRQERAAFAEGSNDLASALSSLLDQVVDGHYSDIPLTCTPSGGGLDVNYGAVGTQQGTHEDCVFLGKVMRFYDGSAGTGDPRPYYQVYSLAAARDATGDLPNATVANIPPLKKEGRINQNLSVDKLDVEDADGSHSTDVFNFGFAQGLGTIDTLSPDVYKSGSQNIGLIYFSGHAWGDDDVGGMYIRPAKSVEFCLTDGTRSANFYIGGTSANSNELSVRVKQLGVAICP